MNYLRYIPCANEELIDEAQFEEELDAKAVFARAYFDVRVRSKTRNNDANSSNSASIHTAQAELHLKDGAVKDYLLDNLLPWQYKSSKLLGRLSSFVSLL